MQELFNTMNEMEKKRTIKMCLPSQLGQGSVECTHYYIPGGWYMCTSPQT